MKEKASHKITAKPQRGTKKQLIKEMTMHSVI